MVYGYISFIYIYPIYESVAPQCNPSRTVIIIAPWKPRTISYTLGSRKKIHNWANDMFSSAFLNENAWISNEISFNYASCDLFVDNHSMIVTETSLKWCLFVRFWYVVCRLVLVEFNGNTMIHWNVHNRRILVIHIQVGDLRMETLLNWCYWAGYFLLMCSPGIVMTLSVQIVLVL